MAVTDEDLTKWFVTHGADPNAQWGLNETPLSIAVGNAPFKAIKLLFDRSATTEHGQLLHHAVYRWLNDRLEVLSYLLEKGALVNNII